MEFDERSELASYLYAPARMEERFRTFSTLTLPSIRAQTDQDFTFLVVTGESLPPVYMTRLLDLVSDVPQVVVKTFPPRRHVRIMQQAINAAREGNPGPCLQFRLDDDDAVGIDFVERLRDEAGALGSFASKRSCLALDFNRGFVCQTGAEGLRATSHCAPYVSAALALLVQANETRSIMNFAHHKIARALPTVTFTDKDMLVRSYGAFNDSRQKPGITTPDMPLLDKALATHFLYRFGIDNNAVKRAWSSA